METGTHDTGSLRGSATQGEEAKAKAKELARTTRERALSALDQGKDQLCGVLDRAAGSMQDDRLGSYAAEYARRGAEYLRRQSADDLYRSARRSLRSRPGVVLGACFVAGLAFARLMKGAAGRGEDWRAGDWRADDRRGDDWRGDDGDLDPGRPGERGHAQGGYREGSWAAPDPMRGEPWREGQP